MTKEQDKTQKAVGNLCSFCMNIQENKSVNKRGILSTWGEQMSKTIQNELAKNSLFTFQPK